MIHNGFMKMMDRIDQVWTDGRMDEWMGGWLDERSEEEKE